MQTTLVIIQPTTFCNLNCSYCYLPYRSIKKRISFETLSQIFKQVLSSHFIADEVTVLWHAGEPLVLPVSFYEEAFALQQRWNTRGVKIVNSLQTNATLITQRWCDLFKRHDVKIGISIDGPEQVHDAHRVYRSGKGSFERIMRGIALLRENGISYAMIAVVTSDSVTQPDLLWQFFTELAPTRLGLNPEEIDGIHTSSSLQSDGAGAQYKAFFKRILALSTQVEKPLIIREIETLFEHIASGSQHTRAQANVPLTLLNFDCAGNISTFSPELLNMQHPVFGDFIFGNIYDHTLDDILTNPKYLLVNDQIQQGVAKCRASCDYFMFCGGGSPSNKLFEHGTFDCTETTACRLRVKVAVDAFIEHLETAEDNLA